MRRALQGRMAPASDRRSSFPFDTLSHFFYLLPFMYTFNKISPNQTFQVHSIKATVTHPHTFFSVLLFYKKDFRSLLFFFLI